MPLSVERCCVEAVFFVALAGATAVLHYFRGFSFAFASFSSSQSAAAAASSDGPLYNYLSLLAAAATTYAAARTAAFYGASAFPSPQSQKRVRRAALALCLPAVSLVCYVGAGYPPVGESAVARWIIGNWERNGERDLWWCGRLFALLFCWQAVLAAVVAACRAIAGVVSWQVSWVLEATSGRGKPGGSGGVELLQPQQQLGDARGSSSSSSCDSWIGDGMPAASGGEGEESRQPSSAERDHGAPGWGGERSGGE